jgi:hypothetical protein
MQASTQRRQWLQRVQSISLASPSTRVMAPSGHAFAQAPQRRQLASRTSSVGERCCDSGFAHQRHRSGQPFRNTVVRIPGPSWMLKRWMSNTTPDGSGALWGAGLGMSRILLVGAIARCSTTLSP